MPTITINTEEMREIGDNVSATLQGNNLILVLDVTKDFGLSSSGKMRCTANTGGFQNAPGGLRANIYVGKKI